MNGSRWLFLFLALGCGMDHRYQVDSGEYLVNSTCKDADRRTGRLTITQNHEFFGRDIVSYSFNDGKEFGFPQNQIAAKEDVLSSEGPDRVCKTPMVQDSDYYLFVCRGPGGEYQCRIEIKLR